jgi:polysaccharide deacetylase 2 family uncharacterized protein YibQ
MPKRTAPSSASPRAVILLAATTLVLFALGEAVILGRTDSGRIVAARHLRIGDPAHIRRLVGKHIRRGLDAAGVPPDSVTETVLEGGPAVLRWRAGLGPDASLLQTNYAITQCVEEQGAEVLSGRERPGRHGETIVTMRIGFPGRPTHEVVLVRPPPRAEDATAGAGRLALVLYAFGDDTERAAAFFRLRLPFAVALVPGASASRVIFRAARERQREVVLHLPLEPINYPQVNPGPGTILVTMRPSRITALVRRYLDQAGPVSAVANLTGSLATQDMTVVSAVYQELKRRRLPFLHVTPAAGAVCKNLAANLGVAYYEPDAVLDAEAKQAKPKALNARWAQILKQARERGRLLVMVRATPLTLNWLPGALSPKELGGVSVVPVSALLHKPAAL